MSALLRHPAVLEDDDVVEADDGGEPVGHQHEGAIPRHPAERLEHRRLRLRVQRRGGLVQDEDGGAAHQGPGERDPLALAAREPRAPLADGRVVALGQAPQCLVDAGVPRGRLDLLVGRARPTEPDVLADRQVEQIALLVHHADLAPERRLRRAAEVRAVERHRARARVVEPQQQAEHGRLPAAARSDDGHGAPGGNRHADVPEDRARSVVPEADVVEPDAPRERAERPRAGRVPHVRALGEERLDPAQSRRGLLEARHDARQLLDGGHDEPHQLEEGDQRADGQLGPAASGACRRTWR